jgi:tRNA pseudouridine38-40 synthase
MRIRLIVEYEGTSYAGWQRQLNGLSVQQALEEAFEKVSGQRASITGAGRTDAGVHALAQVAHLDTNCTIPPERISYAINSILPPDIRVKRSELVDAAFHARFDACGKTYRYTIYRGAHPSAIYRNLSWNIRGELDVPAMREAGAYLVGEHDFAAFCAAGSEVKDTVRTIHAITLTETDPFLYIDVTGSGFLYHMVRIIAGTLADVGLGRIPPERVKEILDGKDRSAASPTAPAQGLTMVEVYYDRKSFNNFLIN